VLSLHRATPRLFVTRGLVAICVVVFLAQQAPSPGVTEAGVNYGPLSLGDEPWRLLTCLFLHGDVMHIAFNMGVLWGIGREAERLFGNGPFLGLYLLSGLGSSLLSASWGAPVPSLGASGAVMGVVGALVVGLRRSGLPTTLRAFAGTQRQLIWLAGATLAIGLLPGIDNAGHLGGLLTGLVAGALMHRRVPIAAGAWRRQLAGGALLAAILAGIFLALRG
jgi:rhomboid protease GluP